MGETPLEREFFNRYQRFLDDHDGCPDSPQRLKYFVWLPQGRPECSVTLSCICGGHVTLPTSRREVVVETMRMNGIPVTESDAGEGVH
jgi:hypothetical protein